MSGKINVAMVGLGACGGSITECAVASELTKDVLVINASEEDLESLSLLDTDSKLKIPGIGGAAKDRQKIYDQFRKDGTVTKFMAAFDARIGNTPHDIVFVVAASGGGTGSGLISVIPRVIRKAHPELMVIPIVVIPNLSERGIPQQNTLDCIKELENGGFTLILVNNERISEGNLFAKYDEINKETIENLRRFVQFDKISKFQNIDTADRLAMFSDPGILVIGSSLVDPEEDSPMRNAVRRALASTPMSADIAGNIKRVALQCEMDSQMYTEENRSDTVALFKNVAGVFEGFYEPDESAGNLTNRILVVISGAHMNADEVRERESLANQQFTEDTTKAVKINGGNSKLKQIWASSTASDAAGSSEEKKDEGYDDIFAEIDDIRK